MTNLLKALHKFSTSVKPITKDASNPFFKSSYASHDHIQEHIKPTLITCGLVVAQPTCVIDGKEYVKTIVFHAESGESIESIFPIVVTKASAQDYGSAVSYAKRYSITGILNLTIQGLDDDGETAEGRGVDKPWLNKDSEQFNKAKNYILGGGSISEIEKKYKLSKEVKTLLNSKP
jgi:hypothetical protein